MLSIIKTYGELIIAAIVLGGILAVGAYGMYVYKDRKALQQEVKILKAEIKQKEEAWGKEVIKWQNEVLRRQQELDATKKLKDAIIKKERQKFDTIFKQTNSVEQKVENELKENVQLRDGIVSVPSDFVRYYNTAVESSRVASEGGEIRFPEDRQTLVGESVTYDAATFSEIVVGNALACAALTLRHNTLVDIVSQLETANVNIDRINGKTKEDRGNLPDRVIESIF